MNTPFNNSQKISFGRYYFGIIKAPFRYFSLLVNDQRRLFFGFCALAITMLLYTCVYIFLTMGGGAPSTFKPWLAIPAESYYFYDRFMLAPSLILCWIAAAGVAQLLSRFFKGSGQFEDNLSVYGFAISIATLASLLHDLPDSFLGALGILDLGAYEVALNSPTIWRTILWVLYLLSVFLFLSSLASAQKQRSGCVGDLPYLQDRLPLLFIKVCFSFSTGEYEYEHF